MVRTLEGLGATALAASKAAASDGRSGASLLEVLRRDYECPITCDIMSDPVLAEDSCTYEREAIERHLAGRAVSPMTNLPMGPSLRPNRALKSAIDTWRAMGGTS